MFESINTIYVLSDQISAILDLLQMSEDSVDIKSVKIASEMCMTMHEELMEEVKKIETEWKDSIKEQKENGKNE